MISSARFSYYFLLIFDCGQSSTNIMFILLLFLSPQDNLIISLISAFHFGYQYICDPYLSVFNPVF